jgi:hypothetical protein
MRHLSEGSRGEIEVLKFITPAENIYRRNPAILSEAKNLSSI